MTAFIGQLSDKSPVGEKTVYQLLDKTIGAEAGSYCYYEPIIGDIHPDFLIFSPKMGILVIEIENSSSTSLTQISGTENWRGRLNGKEKDFPNPFNQLCSFWEILKQRISIKEFHDRRDIPIHPLIVFPNIAKESASGGKILGLKPERTIVLFKENLASYQVFQECLEPLISADLQLSPQEMQHIRGSLILTSRLPHPTQEAIHSFIQSMTTNQVLKLLDNQQEQFASNLGEGHRLVFGVAGSGKTVVLVARARFLALRYPTWRILILCYNRLLANYLQQLLNPSDYQAEIEISNFHKWARSLLTSKSAQYRTKYCLKKADVEEGHYSLDTFFRDFVPSLLQQLISGVSIEHYDAILIDEAQDFEKEWLIPILKLLNPKTNSLLIACDGLQGIYARKRFYWSDVGVQARGRVTRFRKTYRTPKNIGKLAYQFLTLDSDMAELIEREEAFLATKDFSRGGGNVTVQVFSKRKDEYNAILSAIEYFQGQKMSVLLLFSRNLEKINFQHPLISLLNEAKITWHNLRETSLGSMGIYIGTLQGTKGLEADAVIIPEVDSLRASCANRQLLYVGMTRAFHALMLTASREMHFVKELANLT
ncbi:MAG: UvrD-helicase domain-containing protein [Candidatus Hodarchaeota archaeon]